MTSNFIENQGFLRKRIILLAWPAILEMFLHTTVWIVDTAMVGRLGAAELSAVGLGSQILFSTVFVFSAIGVGTTAIIARYFGANEKTNANYAASQSLLLSIVTGVILSVIGIYVLIPIIKMLNLEPNVITLTADYLNYVLPALLFMVPMFVAIAISRGTGNNKIPLFVGAITNLVNIILDYVLIFGKLGLPAMGVKGAALAALIAHFIGLLVVILLIFSDKVDIRINTKDFFRFDKEIIKKILKLSIPAGIQEFADDGSRTIFTVLVASVGAVQFAAHQATIAIESISFMPGFGFAISSSIIVGQSLGAKNYEDAEKSVIESSKMGLSLMTFMAIIFFFFPYLLARIFVTDPEVIKWAGLCIRISAFIQPALALNMIISGALRGAGDTKWPMYAALIGNWAVRFPLTLLSLFVWKYPITAIWLIMILDHIVRFLIVAIRFKSMKWKKIKI